MNFDRDALLAHLATTPFHPPFWARGGFAQTLVAAFGRPAPRPRLELQRLTTPDGDFVRLHQRRPDPAAPTLLLLHGLEGSVRSAYVGAAAASVAELGWNFAVLEFRSCGGEPNRRLRSYHSGETGDLAFVVDHLLRETRGDLLVLGVSLGGNVLLKWLGELGDRVPARVRAAAAISPPFDLEVAARQCDRRHGGAIARHFLRTLVPKAMAKARQFPGVLDDRAVRRCRSFAAFDDLVTAPLHGFASALHYWRSQSCAQFLPGIRRPTVLIAADDDPLVPASVWPASAVAASPFLVAQRQRRGGHCGFVHGGTPWRPRRWAEAQAVRAFTWLLRPSAHAAPIAAPAYDGQRPC